VTVTRGHILSPAEFNALFDSFTATVVRLEALPAYAVGGAEGERLAAFRAGQPRPLRSVRTDPWLARIAVTTVTAGKRWSRVRVVDDPLTDYERYELASYRESQSVGEEIQIAQRRDVGDVGVDFWLFDDRHVVLMHYHPDGSVDRRELCDDADVVAECRARLTAVEAAAVPLNVALVGLGG
jgi:uncharacterized protein DUF6879